MRSLFFVCKECGTFIPVKSHTTGNRAECTCTTQLIVMMMDLCFPRVRLVYYSYTTVPGEMPLSDPGNDHWCKGAWSYQTRESVVALPSHPSPWPQGTECGPKCNISCTQIQKIQNMGCHFISLYGTSRTPSIEPKSWDEPGFILWKTWALTQQLQFQHWKLWLWKLTTIFPNATTAFPRRLCSISRPGLCRGCVG